MSPAMANATMTLTSEVESLIDTLCDLLDRESAAVQQADYATFKGMQSDKVSLLTRYRAIMDTLTRQKAQLESADAAITDRLKAVARKFAISADRNTRALDAGRASMQRIVDRIVRAARETVHGNSQVYKRNGTTSARMSLSIQVDEVL